MNKPPVPVGRAAALLRRFLSLRLAVQFAIFLACTLPVVWLIAGLQLVQLQTIAERESNRDVTNLSQAFAEEVNSSVGTIDQSLVFLRQHWMRNRADFREIVASTQNFLEDRIIFQIAVTDARGMMLFSSADPQAKPLDLSDREHVRVHLENPQRGDKLFVSKPVLGRVSGKWSIQFTRPLYAADGRLDGVIVASVAPDYFSRFYEHIYLGTDGVVTLTRDDGTVIARSAHDSSTKGIGKVLKGTPFDAPPGTTDGLYRRVSQVDQVDRFYAWRRLPRFGLMVLVGQSVSDASQRYASQRGDYLAGATVLSLLIALFGFFVLLGLRQRARAAEALAESEARWKFALEGAKDGVWDWDIAGRRAQLSRRSMELLQQGQEWLACTPQTLEDIVHPDDVAAVSAALRAHFNGSTPTFVLEHRVRLADNRWRWLLTRGMVVKRNAAGKPERMVGTTSDITERKTSESLIKHLAQHDSLTDLPNRTLFRDRLHQAILRARRETELLAVLYLDLDGFKPVNDTWGHETGDALLVEVASRVRACLRASDTVARVGGDEFAVLLPTVRSEADARDVAATILVALSMPFRVEGHDVAISASIGIATYPFNGQDDATLVRRADRAMYLAKERGRNRLEVSVERDPPAVPSPGSAAA